MTILSLFPAHRRLLAQLDRLRDQATAQQDEIRHLKRRADQAEEERAAAVERAAKSWELVANWLAKRSGLGSISMPDEQIPDAPRPDMTPVPQAKPLGSAVVKKMYAQFDRDLEDVYRESQKPAEG